MKNVRYETSWSFRKKRRGNIWKKINVLETNNKNKNIRDLYRGINEFKKDYQPRSNLVKDENGDLVADSHNVFLTDGRTSSVSYWIYMVLIMSGR